MIPIFIMLHKSAFVVRRPRKCRSGDRVPIRAGQPKADTKITTNRETGNSPCIFYALPRARKEAEFCSKGAGRRMERPRALPEKAGSFWRKARQLLPERPPAFFERPCTFFQKAAGFWRRVAGFPEKSPPAPLAGGRTSCPQAGVLAGVS